MILLGKLQFFKGTKMQDQIINYIRRNRVSTTEVADCLNKSGSLPGIYALNRGHFCVGTVKWVYGWKESNWPIHEQIQDVTEGSIVIIEDLECNNRALIGDIVSKYLILYRQCLAVVVDGTVRDAPRLLKEDWPIWCRGVNPVGCFNYQPDSKPSREIIDAKVQRFDGAIAICDDCGVVVIEKLHQNQEMLERLEWIEEQEDTWFDCIDRRKWTTFDTICLKKYQ